MPEQATRKHNPDQGLEPTSRPRQGGTYRLGETFIFPFEFTEPVVVRGVPTMPLELDSGTVRARYHSGSGTKRLLFAYTVQTGDYEEDGGRLVGPFVRFEAGDSYMTLDGASVRALADGSPALLVTDADWNYPYGTFGGSHKMEGRPAFAKSASISSSPESGTTYGTGETITIRLAMHVAVRVTGRPSIRLDVGGARRWANYSGPIGSATDALEFSYVVQSGDFDADGVALCASGPGCGLITLDGGTIRATADEADANLVLPALAAQSGHKVDAAEPLPMRPTACTAEVGVPSDWALKPSGVTTGGKFRLLFITSASYNATSRDIDHYNRLVQARAAAGHASIRDYSTGFRVVGSTASVDARDNTCTTGTGALIHWLGSNKAADSYTDFYDGSWDNETSRRNENGGSLAHGVTRVWTGSSHDGTGFSGQELGASSVMRASYNHLAGATDGPLEHLPVAPSINTGRLYGLSQVFVVKADLSTPTTNDISIISSPAAGGAYRLGETIQIKVTYSDTVTVGGTPGVGLSIKSATGTDDNEYNALYSHGSGTRELVFGFTVPSGLKDDDGIELASDPLRLNGAAIVESSEGRATVWNLAAERNIGGKVDSSQTFSGGVCDRTLQVRNAILSKVATNDNNVSNCSQVTEVHLAAVTGVLFVENLTSLAAGDFAGLSGIREITVSGSGIETLPAGLFDGLSAHIGLGLQIGLTHLPKDYFRGLGRLAVLNLSGNRLAAGSLPDGIFEPLTKLINLELIDNPGSDSFTPMADAGPGGVLSAGQTVTLGGPGTGGGPWGSNLIYSWTQTDGDDMSASTVTLSATDVAKPGFIVPTLSSTTDVKLRLRVRGQGGNFTAGRATSTAEFTIRALAPTGVAVVSEPVDGSDTYKLGEKIEAAVTFGDRVLVDTSLGTPTLGFGLGSSTANKQARYLRGSGTNRLVFEYTVQALDLDNNGIEFPANSLVLNGAAITSIYGVEALLTYSPTVRNQATRWTGRGILR